VSTQETAEMRPDHVDLIIKAFEEEEQILRLLAKVDPLLSSFYPCIDVKIHDPYFSLINKLGRTKKELRFTPSKESGGGIPWALKVTSTPPGSLPTTHWENPDHRFRGLLTWVMNEDFGGKLRLDKMEIPHVYFMGIYGKPMEKSDIMICVAHMEMKKTGEGPEEVIVIDEIQTHQFEGQSNQLEGQSNQRNFIEEQYNQRNFLQALIYLVDKYDPLKILSCLGESQEKTLVRVRELKDKLLFINHDSIKTSRFEAPLLGEPVQNSKEIVSENAKASFRLVCQAFTDPDFYLQHFKAPSLPPSQLAVAVSKALKSRNVRLLKETLLKWIEELSLNGRPVTHVLAIGGETVIVTNPYPLKRVTFSLQKPSTGESYWVFWGSRNPTKIYTEIEECKNLLRWLMGDMTCEDFDKEIQEFFEGLEPDTNKGLQEKEITGELPGLKAPKKINTQRRHELLEANSYLFKLVLEAVKTRAFGHDAGAILVAAMRRYLNFDALGEINSFTEEEKEILNRMC